MSFFGRLSNMFNISGSNFNNSFNRNRMFRGSRLACPNYKLVPFEQARNMIEMNEVNLIDIRTESEYNLMHIKNAVNIPVDCLEAKLLDNSLAKDKCFMVYCSSGARSKKAIQILNKYGYEVYIWEYAALTTFPYRDMLVYNKN